MTDISNNASSNGAGGTDHLSAFLDGLSLQIDDVPLLAQSQQSNGPSQGVPDLIDFITVGDQRYALFEDGGLALVGLQTTAAAVKELAQAGNLALQTGGAKKEILERMLNGGGNGGAAAKPLVYVLVFNEVLNLTDGVTPEQRAEFGRLTESQIIADKLVDLGFDASIGSLGAISPGEDWLTGFIDLLPGPVADLLNGLRNGAASSPLAGANSISYNGQELLQWDADAKIFRPAEGASDQSWIGDLGAGSDPDYADQLAGYLLSVVAENGLSQPFAGTGLEETVFADGTVQLIDRGDVNDPADNQTIHIAPNGRISVRTDGETRSFDAITPETLARGYIDVDGQRLYVERAVDGMQVSDGNGLSITILYNFDGEVTDWNGELSDSLTTKLDIEGQSQPIYASLSEDGGWQAFTVDLDDPNAKKIPLSQSAEAGGPNIPGGPNLPRTGGPDEEPDDNGNWFTRLLKNIHEGWKNIHGGWKQWGDNNLNAVLTSYHIVLLGGAAGGVGVGGYLIWNDRTREYVFDNIRQGTTGRDIDGILRGGTQAANNAYDSLSLRQNFLSDRITEEIDQYAAAFAGTGGEPSGAGSFSLSGPLTNLVNSYSTAMTANSQLAVNAAEALEFGGPIIDVVNSVPIEIDRNAVLAGEYNSAEGRKEILALVKEYVSGRAEDLHNTYFPYIAITGYLAYGGIGVKKTTPSRIREAVDIMGQGDGRGSVVQALEVLDADKDLIKKIVEYSISSGNESWYTFTSDLRVEIDLSLFRSNFPGAYRYEPFDRLKEEFNNSFNLNLDSGGSTLVAFNFGDSGVTTEELDPFSAPASLLTPTQQQFRDRVEVLVAGGASYEQAGNVAYDEYLVNSLDDGSVGGLSNDAYASSRYEGFNTVNPDVLDEGAYTARFNQIYTLVTDDLLLAQGGNADARARSEERGFVFGENGLLDRTEGGVALQAARYSGDKVADADTRDALDEVGADAPIEIIDAILIDPEVSDLVADSPDTMTTEEVRQFVAGLSDPETQVYLDNLASSLAEAGTPENIVQDVLGDVIDMLRQAPYAIVQSIADGIEIGKTAIDITFDLMDAFAGNDGRITGILINPNDAATSQLIEISDSQRFVRSEDGQWITIHNSDGSLATAPIQLTEGNEDLGLVINGPDGIQRTMRGVANLFALGVFGDGAERTIGQTVLLVDDVVSSIDTLVDFQRIYDFADLTGNEGIKDLADGRIDAEVLNLVGLGFDAVGLLSDDPLVDKISALGSTGVQFIEAIRGINAARSALSTASLDLANAIPGSPAAASAAADVDAAGNALGASIANMVSVGFTVLGLLAGDNKTLQDIAKYGGVAATAVAFAFAPGPLAAIGLFFGVLSLFSGPPRDIDLTDTVDVTGDGSNDEVQFERKSWDYEYRVSLDDGAVEANSLTVTMIDGGTGVLVSGELNAIFPGITDNVDFRVSEDDLNADQIAALTAAFGSQAELSGAEADAALDTLLSIVPSLGQNSFEFDQLGSLWGLNFLSDVNGDGILDRVQQFTDLDDLDGPSYEDRPAFAVSFRNEDGVEYYRLKGESIEDIGQAAQLRPYTLSYIASHPDLMDAWGGDLDANLMEATEHLLANLGESGEQRGITFDATAYLLSNPDLVTAYGSDLDQAAAHFIRHGRHEDRTLINYSADMLIAHPVLASDPAGVLTRMVEILPEFATVLDGFDLSTATPELVSNFLSLLVASQPSYAGVILAAVAPADPTLAPQDELSEGYVTRFSDSDGDGKGHVLFLGEWIEREVEDVHEYQRTGIGTVVLSDQQITVEREGGAFYPETGIGSAITNGQILPNQYLQSENGQFRAAFLPSGSFAVYDNTTGAAIWEADRDGNTDHGFVAVQSDGNLVIYDDDHDAEWSSGTSNHINRDFTLAMQDDGNLVLYDDLTGQPLWSSHHGTIAVAEQYPPVNLGSTMASGLIQPNQYLESDDQRYRAIFRPDGNFVVFDTATGTNIWVADRSGNTDDGYIGIQNDGNLVVYDDDGDAEWASNTANPDGLANRNFTLAMQTDGNLVLYDDMTGQALWSSQHGTLAQAIAQPSAGWSDIRALEYIASHDDLMDTYGLSSEAGRTHHTNWGYGEGRMISFSAVNYLAANADLQTAFGTDLLGATRHYMEYGRYEGRSLAPGQAPEAADVRPVFSDADGNGVGEVTIGGQTYTAQVEEMTAYLRSGIGMLDLGDGRRFTATRDGGAFAPVTYLGDRVTNVALTVNQYIESANGQYYAMVQDNGDFVVREKIDTGEHVPIWASNTAGETQFSSLAIQETDGNLVLYSDAGQSTWSSNTYSTEGLVNREFTLLMQDDGNLVLYDDKNGQALWSSQHGTLAQAVSTGGFTIDRALVDEYIADPDGFIGPYSPDIYNQLDVVLDIYVEMGSDMGKTLAELAKFGIEVV